MVAIYDPGEDVDTSDLGISMKSQLPSFARPIFLRLVKQLDITGNIYSPFENNIRRGINLNRNPDLIITIFNA